jgi:hypothetical protein
MGSKFSKSQDKNNEESAEALSHESTKDGVLGKSPSFTRKFSCSCLNWATKRGLMRNAEAGKSETDSVGRDAVVEVEFRQEVAYTCGEGKTEEDTPDNKDGDASNEVYISSVIKHLVIEAQKKKAGSRPNSRVFSNVTSKQVTECQTDTSEKEVTKSENVPQIEDNMTKDVDGKKDTTAKRDLDIGNHKESADLIAVEIAKDATDNSEGENDVISHNVDKLVCIVGAESAAVVFSSSQLQGKGDSNNENGGNVEILCMDNPTTETEEESKKQPELKNECEEIEKFIHLIIKEIVQDMIL